MITPDLISYIKAELAKGSADAAIKSGLLANGWNEQEIGEAIASLSGAGTASALVRSVTSDQLKAYRNKVKWITFSTLAGIDIVIIAWFKYSYGVYGLFGLSLVSAAVRLLVIYLISSFASHGSSMEDTKSKAVAKSVAKVIGSIVIAIVVIMGIFFALCLFAFSHSNI